MRSRKFARVQKARVRTVGECGVAGVFRTERGWKVEWLECVD